MPLLEYVMGKTITGKLHPKSNRIMLCVESCTQIILKESQSESDKEWAKQYPPSFEGVVK